MKLNFFVIIPILIMFIFGAIGFYFGYKQSIRDKEHYLNTARVYAAIFIAFAAVLYAIIFTLYLLIIALIK